MPRRSLAALLFLLTILSSLPVSAMELGPPARNLLTYREDDAGYVSLAWSTDRLEMKEKSDHRFVAPGLREVERQMAYLSVAWLPSDRVEMDARIGVQGMRVGNGLLVDGVLVDGASRMAGLAGGGIRWLAWEHPDAGVRLGVVADGAVSFFRWKPQRNAFLGAADNASVTVDSRYGEFAEARLALPVSKVFRFAPRGLMDTSTPRTVASTGGIDFPWPAFTALEVYAGPFVRGAYMYGNMSATAGTTSLGSTRFHLLQDSLFGGYGGLRAWAGRTHRWSVGVEGRYQSDLSLSVLVDASL